MLVRAPLWHLGRVIGAGMFLAACQADQPTTPVPAGPESEVVTLVTSAKSAPPGSRVVVAVVPPWAEARAVAGLQGRISFDPAALEFVGQSPRSETLVIVNNDAASRGELKFLAYSDTRIEPDDVAFVFVVRRAGYAPHLRLRLDGAVPPGSATPLPLAAARAVVERAELPVPSDARRLTIDDWIAYLGLNDGGERPAKAGAIAFAGGPGQGFLYGDASLNGVISVLDAALAANVAVGNFPLLTNPDMDLVIAANVAPPNLPGLGEPEDAVPPGRAADGQFVINVSDVAAIKLEVLHTDQPIVGEAIPGRVAATNRAVVSGMIPIGVTRSFSRDTVYELQGVVDVHGTLIIPAGTRIEGDSASRGTLVIRRGGNLLATGTRLQPVVFTCNAAVKASGCWGGLHILGFAPLNNAQSVSGDDITGCPEKTMPGSTAVYGGCSPHDTSGVLRYVRVEHGGMGLAGGSPVPSLSLLGVGGGTKIDSVQVHGGSADGLLLSGGDVDFRHVVLTNHLGTALRWDDGWRGRAQFVIIHQDFTGGDAIRGANFAGNPDATPRSAPRFYNVTISGPGASNGSTALGIRLDHGTDATFRNTVVLRPGGAGLEIDGAATCARALLSGGIAIEHSIFFAGTPDFSADGDCLDEDAYANDPSRQNRVIDPLLVEPFGTITPDFRPTALSPATSGYVEPPSDGFFTPQALYVGAVAPVVGAGNIVPWYPGWTRGWGN